jgi:hypothetical protein
MHPRATPLDSAIALVESGTLGRRSRAAVTISIKPFRRASVGIGGGSAGRDAPAYPGIGSPTDGLQQAVKASKRNPEWAQASDSYRRII